MKNYILAALIYGGFFGVIGFAMWISGTAWPLFALLLTPSMKFGEKDD